MSSIQHRWRQKDNWGEKCGNEALLMKTERVGNCACCGNPRSERDDITQFFGCDYCGHQWLPANTRNILQHYAELSGRNAMPVKYLDIKLQERVNFILPMLHDGMRVLEVGCAEGDLGRSLKEYATIYYAGVELSGDAIVAEGVLDSVSREPNAFLDEQQFDLIICFHVLEHIVEPLVELANWKRMLKWDGRIVVEVPNESGHPYIIFDQNPEHIHHFCVSSISSLMRRANFNVINVLTDCFESPSYFDSIRLVARNSLSDEEKQQQLQQLLAVIDQNFDVYGVGGDFGNYILPVLEELAVDTLYDSHQQQHGKVFGRYSVSPFDININLGKPILIASIRFQGEIKQFLLRSGVAEHQLIYLSDILMKGL